MTDKAHSSETPQLRPTPALSPVFASSSSNSPAEAPQRPGLYGVDGFMTSANVQLPLPAGNVDEIQTPVRRPRKQVSRACDWCRARKIRCDNAQPCKACRQRNAQCTHKGIEDEPRTLPQALRYEVYMITDDTV